jgi:uncharacterized CHY-type Zn-finger protein
MVCNKKCYPMDLFRIDDRAIHKNCLRCAHCKSTLTLGKYAALEGRFYCKPHFKQLFAVKGNYTEGFLASNGENSNENQNPLKLSLKETPTRKISSLSEKSASPITPAFGENSLPIVNKSAKAAIDYSKISRPSRVSNPARFETSGTAEISEEKSSTTKLIEKYNASSKEDLRGSNKNLSEKRNLSRSIMDLLGSREDIKASKDSLHGQNSTASKVVINQNKSVCSVCDKRVYPMEAIQLESWTLHKSCLKCTHCKATLTLGKYAALDGKYYCKPHFKQLFALKGNYNEGFGTKQHKDKWAAASPNENHHEAGADPVHQVSMRA